MAIRPSCMLGPVVVESRPRGPVEVFLPQTYAAGMPYALFAGLRASAPVCWIDEPPEL